MNGKGWLIVAGVLMVAALVVVLWPSDPLAGVETVAIAGPDAMAPALTSKVFDGLEIALGERRIRIVANASEADAVITLEPQEADIRINEQGFFARVRCLVTRDDGRQQVMYLYVTLDDQGLKARLESRKFFEFWK